MQIAVLRSVQTLKRSARATWFIAMLLLIPFFSSAQKQLPRIASPADFTRDYKPFRLCGNLYYVGTYDLACYLLTTPRGHMLFNTGPAESVDLIRSPVSVGLPTTSS